MNYIYQRNNLVDSINILIVDGNDKDSSEEYIKLGMNTLFEEYKNILTNLSPIKLNIKIIHPAWNKNFFEKGISIDDFHGIVWTGSVLNIYDNSPSIVRQIELAKILLKKKNKIFGSCWGLQVLTTAAGGLIRKNPKGLEAVVSKNIFLTEKGIIHHMYINKPKQFDSFCWHYDEVEKIPENSIVLAHNNYSNVQALTFTIGHSEVWAVQYHPEFNPYWVSGLMAMRKKILLDNEIYKNETDYESMREYLSDIKNNNNLKKDLKIKDSLIDDSMRYIELYNWLENLSQ